MANSNFEELTNNMFSVIEKSQDIFFEYSNKFLQKDKNKEENFSSAIQINQTYALYSSFKDFVNNPNKALSSQIDLIKKQIQVWQDTFERLTKDEEDKENNFPKNRRFKDNAWQSHVIFEFIKKSYLTYSQWLNRIVEESEIEDEHLKKQIAFYVKQITDAISPTNFPNTNPEVIRQTLETNGKNLANGLSNLLNDIKNSKNSFEIPLADPNAFKVGENLAITEGSVIYQNKLQQLIHYKPTQKNIHSIPIFIIAPWINKYYVLDLKPENSFVKWLVDQGYDVFITSWANPDKSFSEIDFEDYLKLGFLDPIKKIKEITNENQVNVISYCLGGTLTACALSYLKKHKDKTIKSATFLTTMIDFSEPGELGVFLDDFYIKEIKQDLKKQGFLDGHDLSNIFKSLRSYELVWRAFTHNYLLGKNPPPFDLLYWNSDPTNLPATMHIYYLENMYRDNLLIQKNALKMLETTIDLSVVDTPCYFLSTKDDHIAPWQSTFKGMLALGKNTKFVLSESGHVAGVINPTNKNKYGFWHNEAKEKNPDIWLKNAQKTDYSWWINWNQWMTKNKFTGKKRLARLSKKEEIIEPAPGSYVKNRI